MPRAIPRDRKGLRDDRRPFSSAGSGFLGCSRYFYHPCQKNASWGKITAFPGVLPLTEPCNGQEKMPKGIFFFFPRKASSTAHARRAGRRASAGKSRAPMEKTMLRVKGGDAMQAIHYVKEDPWEEFEEEFTEMEERIARLEKENAALRSENHGLRDKLDRSGRVPVLYLGKEEDMYEGEIKDMILSTLDSAIRTLPKESRRYDVLSDILKANDYEALTQERAKEVRQLFKDEDRLTERSVNALNRLGYDVRRGGKHYKVSYGKHTTTCSLSPSDTKAAGNMAKTLVDMAY